MNEYVADSGPTRARTTRRIRYALPAAILLVLLTAFLGYRAWTDRGADSTPAGTERISAAELEERFGLRVRLIGVTAGGGMVDFRLKILDAEKAKQLLRDPERMPSLIVEQSGTTLTNPAGADPDLPVEEGGVFFVLFPNSGGAVKPGTSVIVAFGDLRLEPMTAQ